MSMRCTSMFLLMAMTFMVAACQGSDSARSTDATQLDTGPMGADTTIDTIDPPSVTATTTASSGTDPTGTVGDPGSTVGDPGSTVVGSRATGPGTTAGGQAAAQPTNGQTTNGQGTAAAGPTQTIGAIPVSDQGLEGAELEQYLARRYEAFWFTFDQARRSPPSNAAAANPELANLASGEQLTAANAELADMAATGQALRDPDQPALPGLDHDRSIRIRVDRVDGSVAELTACLVNDQVRYQVADDAVVSSGVVTVQATATMARTDGTWKLIRSQAVALDPGIGGCWLEDEANFPL